MHELSKWFSLGRPARKQTRYRAIFSDGRPSFDIVKQGRWWRWRPVGQGASPCAGYNESSHLGNVKFQVEQWGGKVVKVSDNRVVS